MTRCIQILLPLTLIFAAYLPIAAQTPSPDSSRTDELARGPNFSGEISLSGAVTRSTINSDKVAAGFTLDAEFNEDALGPKHQLSLIDVAGSYDSKQKKNASATITRSYTGWVQHLVFLRGNQWYASGNARFLHNNALGVYLQQRYSVLGGYILRSRGRVVELNAGPAFVGQNFIGEQPSTGFPAAELRETLSFPFPLIRANTRLSETVRVALPLNPDDPWIGEADAQLLVPLTSAISLSVTALDYYISNPPAGSDKHFLNLSFGITIPIGK